jgi:hypothetical protein
MVLNDFIPEVFHCCDLGGMCYTPAVSAQPRQMRKLVKVQKQLRECVRIYGMWQTEGVVTLIVAHSNVDSVLDFLLGGA